MTLYVLDPSSSISVGGSYPLTVYFSRMDDKNNLVPVGGMRSQQVRDFMIALTNRGEICYEIMICYESFEHVSYTLCTRIKYDVLFDRITTEIC